MISSSLREKNIFFVWMKFYFYNFRYKKELNLQGVKSGYFFVHFNESYEIADGSDALSIAHSFDAV